MRSEDISRISYGSYPNEICHHTRLLAGLPRGALTLALFSLFVLTRPAQSQESVLYTFNSQSNGGYGPFQPESGVTLDDSGNLYGVSLQGGLYGAGAVYELSAGTWEEKTLYSFTGGGDGSCFTSDSAGGECSSLIFDSQGNLYGTAPYGGEYGDGVVFELSPESEDGCPSGSNTGNDWCETVLHTFGNPTGYGIYPQGGVIMDSKGDLYGTTSSYYYEGTEILGVAYELSPSAEGWTEPPPLYSLPYSDVLNPGLVIGLHGYLYGTSTNTVFRLSPNGQGGWAHKVIHTFTGAPKDAGGSSAPLVVDAAGNLYGVSGGGGSKDDGAIYKLTPRKSGGWNERLLHSFTSPEICCYGSASLVLDGTGDLYGTTYYGGVSGYGTVYELVAATNKLKTIFSFNEKDGAYPLAGLIFSPAGNLYGTTSAGGWLGTEYGGGTVFELNPSAAEGRPSVSELQRASAFRPGGWPTL